MMLFQLNEFCGEFETIQENFLASARLPDPSFCITCIDPPGITALTLPTRYCALAVGEIWIEKWQWGRYGLKSGCCRRDGRTGGHSTVA